MRLGTVLLIGLTTGVLFMPNAANGQEHYNERMAAWQDSIVSIDEMRPNACLATYRKDRFAYMEHYVLAKFVPGIEADGAWHWPETATEIEVNDLPGGVQARFSLVDVQVTATLYPLPYGRDAMEWEGGAIYEVQTDPAVPVRIRIGGPREVANGWVRKEWLRTDRLDHDGVTVELEDNRAVLDSAAHPLAVIVTTDGTLEEAVTEGGTPFLIASASDGTLIAQAVYSEEMARTQKLAERDPVADRAALQAHYDELLAVRIETPESVIDDAFRTALLTLEYNWIRPYGWNECIHHWHALWHMQHTGAADWIGQADRSRECITSLAENLTPAGAVPHFSTGGETRRDFGGSNQFYLWQVRNHWLRTGDRDLLEQIAPELDRVIAQTFDEYDPMGNLALAWNQQIGNQEDYVSTPYGGTTPTIEGINMLRSRAKVAEALDDEDTAVAMYAKAERMAQRLRERFWLSDLGRYAFYVDSCDVTRLDSQYHTYIYPLLFDLVDPLDGWSGMRHLRDRLMGKGGGDEFEFVLNPVGSHPEYMTDIGGEIYCSNNFPNHVGGTWGMQAGAAQQPWGAWGLAALGRNNETYLPLRAIASWVMGPYLRGAWPEVAMELTAAYFSPPAGLYVQATIEALFGLDANVPKGVLTISPSFPDDWPSARIQLPDYEATYTRTGNTVEYHVQSAEPLSRRIRWHVPAATVTAVEVNGQPIPFEIEPWVDGIVVTAETDPVRQTRISMTYEPLEYALDHVGSIAEGDVLDINVDGVIIRAVEDRYGVLSEARTEEDGAGFRGTIRTGLLDPYAGYGRLGQMNFARRTFFLWVEGPEGLTFWHPVDIAVLPPVKAAPSGSIRPATQGIVVPLTVRNNTFEAIEGTAHLILAQQRIPLSVAIPARSEETVEAVLRPEYASLLAVGDNEASLLLPNGHEWRFNVSASDLYDIDVLQRMAEARHTMLSLPEELLMADTEWRSLRPLHAFGHPPWSNCGPPLAHFPEGDVFVHDDLPGVPFQIPERQFVPVSRHLEQPIVALDLSAQPVRKLYLLVIPFIENHDTFAPVARVTVEAEDGLGAYSRTLHMPGDLDWFTPEAAVGVFSTAHRPRPDRLGLTPLLTADDNDWSEGKPPSFPQPEYWATNRVLQTSGAVFNIVEIDLGERRDLTRLTFESLGSDPAFGIVAVTAQTMGGTEHLEGTHWMPPTRFREPKPVFPLRSEAELANWTFEGEAFSFAAVPRLFSVPTLNSLQAAGETATGKVISPVFTIEEDYTHLWMDVHGGRSLAEEGPGHLSVRLVDAISGEVLGQITPSAKPYFQRRSMDVGSFTGRDVRLHIIDENTEPSFAWIGIRNVRLEVGS